MRSSIKAKGLAFSKGTGISPIMRTNTLYIDTRAVSTVLAL